MIGNPEIDDLLKDHQSGHSSFQIQQFIISKGNYTPYARYKQALREIASRAETVHFAEEMPDDVRREFDEFVRLAKLLKAEIGPLTPERRDQLDREAWVERAKMRCAAELACNGRLSVETVEFIMAFPQADRMAIMNEVDAGLKFLQVSPSLPISKLLEKQELPDGI